MHDAETDHVGRGSCSRVLACPVLEMKRPRHQKHSMVAAIWTLFLCHWPLGYDGNTVSEAFSVGITPLALLSRFALCPSALALCPLAFWGFGLWGIIIRGSFKAEVVRQFWASPRFVCFVGAFSGCCVNQSWRKL
jgi:hypothetical protein